MRSVPEWIGKTDDAQPPDRVRQRILLAHDRKCWATGKPIHPGTPWEAHHAKEIWEGGENRESNLVPVLVDAHKALSALARKRKAKSDRIIRKAYGIRKSRNPMPGSRASRFKRRMDGTVEWRNA